MYSLPPQPSAGLISRRRVRARWSRVTTGLVTVGAIACAPLAPAAAIQLPVPSDVLPAADIGFHDWTRDGSPREIRNDLTGSLSGMVEFVQASTANPTGNRDNNLPVTVADRTALLLFTPSEEIISAAVEVRAADAVLGTVDLNPPRQIPASDQSYDDRGEVAYSLRAWSVELPAHWVKPDLELAFTDDAGRTGTTTGIDIAPPTEMVINNIRLGMLTDAPVSDSHRFIVDPANGATDYFQTIPVSRLTMAQYETVELDEVIAANGDIYTVDNPDPSQGSVYSGTMRENVGKAQVSTGINLATWGITSAPMNQRQPGHTNQRVIHHSAGLYSNGRVTHGLSGGNGMATLYDSVGNELSHELGHSYGLGHYPGQDNNATGDDIIRNASHHMDSGWGYIAHRGLMRSNLNPNPFNPDTRVNNVPFGENLQGRYNFNTDTMAGGWDASPVSDYTHMTGYSLLRAQNNLATLVADTSYPSGYRDWDQETGTWVDAAALNPDFDLPAPSRVGGSVFTLLGGYNPANADQALLYPAFRSNYGVTFDLPQADTTSASGDRVCWLQVDFADQDTRFIALDASDGVKQLNVNISEDDQPTGAQVICREDGQTTPMGNAITIETDLPPMPDPVVVGQDMGFEALRARELAQLEPTLEALSGEAAPVLSFSEMTILRGWADDLSLLGPTAREVAERALRLESDAESITAFLADPAYDSPVGYSTLVDFLQRRGYLDTDDVAVPLTGAITVDGGACLYVDDAGDVLVDPDRNTCATTHGDTWFVDVAGRIHSGEHPDKCLTTTTPVALRDCGPDNLDQRWELGETTADGARQILTASNPGQVLDYYRHAGYPGIYSTQGSGNQLWSGVVVNTNPVVGVLGGDSLQKLWNALEKWDPAVEPLPLDDDDMPGNMLPAGSSAWGSSA